MDRHGPNHLTSVKPPLLSVGEWMDIVQVSWLLTSFPSHPVWDWTNSDPLINQASRLLEVNCGTLLQYTSLFVQKVSWVTNSLYFSIWNFGLKTWDASDCHNLHFSGTVAGPNLLILMLSWPLMYLCSGYKINVSVMGLFTEGQGRYCSSTRHYSHDPSYQMVYNWGPVNYWGNLAKCRRRDWCDYNVNDACHTSFQWD